jgi:hypothetical protein
MGRPSLNAVMADRVRHGVVGPATIVAVFIGGALNDWLLKRDPVGPSGCSLSALPSMFPQASCSFWCTISPLAMIMTFVTAVVSGCRLCLSRDPDPIPQLRVYDYERFLRWRCQPAYGWRRTVAADMDEALTALKL